MKVWYDKVEADKSIIARCHIQMNGKYWIMYKRVLHGNNKEELDNDYSIFQNTSQNIIKRMN